MILLVIDSAVGAEGVVLQCLVTGDSRPESGYSSISGQSPCDNLRVFRLSRSFAASRKEIIDLIRWCYRRFTHAG